MPRPISGSQLDKLGKRLAQPGPISDEDYELLARVAQIYQVLADKVQERLQRLGFEATTRVKTTGTLVDKLRRTHLSLKDIQDLAGARIVIDGGRLDQDRAVRRIVQAFRECPKPPIVTDRREKPSYGYRAVHVIVYEDSMPMEIQIRTELQDTWAQISEKLGDIWGRGIRYGQAPDMPHSPVRLGPLSTRGEVVAYLQKLSEALDILESVEAKVVQLRQHVLAQHATDPEASGQLEELVRTLATARDTLQDQMNTMLLAIRHLRGAT
jgi:Region found in RelA / SpoT proteins